MTVRLPWWGWLLGACLLVLVAGALGGALGAVLATGPAAGLSTLGLRAVARAQDEADRHAAELVAAHRQEPAQAQADDAEVGAAATRARADAFFGTSPAALTPPRSRHLPPSATRTPGDRHVPAAPSPTPGGTLRPGQAAQVERAEPPSPLTPDDLEDWT